MITEEFRLFPYFSADRPPFDLVTWSVLDFDSRRWISVEAPVVPFDECEGEEVCKALLRHLDDLEPGVTRVILSATGELFNVSTDPQNDCTVAINYPLFTSAQLTKEFGLCLQFPQLREIGRFAPCVDLVTTGSQEGGIELLVFKYAMLPEDMSRMWNDAFMAHRLASSRYIVPFHKFIISAVEPRLLGYTAKFIDGGSLFESTRPFRRGWLQQLMNAVDELNLKYGIAHQDIAPRNIIVDKVTERLYLIDFEFSAPIGSEEEQPPRNDIDGVIFTLYEILTRDLSFRENLLPEDFNIDGITSMKT